MAKGRFSGWRTATAPKVVTGIAPDKSKGLVIGIDPDVDKSGVAVFNKHTGEKTLTTMGFWDLVEFLNENWLDIRIVVIEAGFLNTKSNFRDAQQVATALNSNNPIENLRKQKRVGENISVKVGRNHQVGILLVSYCERFRIPHTAIQPTSHKITSTKLFFQMYGIKTAKSEQEKRDAFHIISGYF